MEEDEMDDAGRNGEAEGDLEGAFEDAPNPPGDPGPAEFDFDDFALI